MYIEWLSMSGHLKQAINGFFANASACALRVGPNACESMTVQLKITHVGEEREAAGDNQLLNTTSVVSDASIN